MPQQQDTTARQKERRGVDRIADDIERMLLLAEAAFRPMTERTAAQEAIPTCGLIGQVVIRDPDRWEAFRAELAELMIEYDVDRLDVAWHVPNVVKRFARRRGGPPAADRPAEPVV